MSKSKKMAVVFFGSMALSTSSGFASSKQQKKPVFSENEIEEAVSIALMNRAGVTQAKFMAAWRKFENEEKNG